MVASRVPLFTSDENMAIKMAAQADAPQAFLIFQLAFKWDIINAIHKNPPKSPA
jgi:hypothetical protein